MSFDRWRRMVGTLRISDPQHIDNPELRAFAIAAVWVAKLEDAVDLLNDLVHDLFEERFGENAQPDPKAEQAFYDDEPLAVAASVVNVAFEEADRALEADVHGWLERDPEHWHIFRLIILDPWQVSPGHWRSGVPRWALTLGTNVAFAHFRRDEYEDTRGDQ